MSTHYLRNTNYALCDRLIDLLTIFNTHHFAIGR